MANALRRVPVATKVHPFQAEISGYQQLRTRSNTDNRRIISYSKGKFPAMPEARCLAANCGDQLSFSSWQGSNNIRLASR